jgi:succinate dehydrogenase / fumarate reductase cytochrome b subunit
MNWLTTFLKSSIGKKLLMGLTGLFLCAFLLVHVSGNLQLFKDDGGLGFNTYTAFMTTNPLIKFISYGLYATILFHAIWGLYLAYENKKARPVRYEVFNGKANSHWTSRWMGVLGTAILAFLLFHMWGFWAQYKFGEMPYTQYERNMSTGEISYAPYEGEIHGKMESFVDGDYEITRVKDLFIVVEDAFRSWWIVLIYVISMFAVSFHLVHGFSSSFQTIGINHKKYNGLIKYTGIIVFGVIVPVLFAAMPLYFLFNNN